MVSKVSGRSIDLANLDMDMRANNDLAISSGGETEGAKGGFGQMLAKGIEDVNSSVKAGEKASMDLVSGKSSNIHETMLAVTKAELGFNMLVQMRNKAIEAYQEVMRMQV